ncbi:hypothetical protein SRHO_G00212970 [Serrasalmus rhombeus]
MGAGWPRESGAVSGGMDLLRGGRRSSALCASVRWRWTVWIVMSCVVLVRRFSLSDRHDGDGWPDEPISSKGRGPGLHVELQMCCALHQNSPSSRVPDVRSQETNFTTTERLLCELETLG